MTLGPGEQKYSNKKGFLDVIHIVSSSLDFLDFDLLLLKVHFRAPRVVADMKDMENLIFWWFMRIYQTMKVVTTTLRSQDDTVSNKNFRKLMNI